MYKYIDEQVYENMKIKTNTTASGGASYCRLGGYWAWPVRPRPVCWFVLVVCIRSNFLRKYDIPLPSAF